MVSHSRAEVPSVERSGATRRGGQGDEEMGGQGDGERGGRKLLYSLLSTPHYYQCPMPNAQLPIINYPLPIPYFLLSTFYFLLATPNS